MEPRAVEGVGPRAAPKTMRAAVYRAYGSPDAVTVEEVPIPQPGRGEVLVRVGAAAVNPGDVYLLEGTPYVLRLSSGLRRPKHPILGLALAGTVESAGPDTRFEPGSEILAEVPRGAFAEYAVVPEGALAAKPGNLSMEEAAAIPVCGVTALQALRDVGEVHDGAEILITGASGGVGTFAVQVGKWLDARVTGECSTKNVELVRALGADDVIDYTKEDFAAQGPRYDLILDNVGHRSLSELRRALRPRGMLIPNANKPGGFLGAYVARALRALLVSPFVGQRLRPFSASGRAEDLDTLRALIEVGTLRPVIDTTYPLDQSADALRHYATGHTRGKVVIRMEAS